MGKIYVLSCAYVPGTAVTNHALALLKGLCENGLEVEWLLLLPNDNNDRFKGKIKGLKIRYLWSSRFSRGKFLKHLYKQLTYGWFYLHTLKRGDVVLLMGMSSYIKRLVAKKGIRVFYERTEHPEIESSFRYKCLYSLSKYLESCRKLDGLFVISKSLKEYYIDNGVPYDKITVINMVVDDNRFANIKKQNIAVPYIAYCGNASNSKDGVDDLIKAFRIVSNCINNVRLKIIGPVPKNNSDNSVLIDELGLRNLIDFTGVVPPSEMPQLLKNANVLALFRPNSLQNKYGFPTKLGEYLLTGNPVCVTRVGDIPQFLTHQETALLSECGDIQGFAMNLIWCLSHPNESNRIGERGKKIAQTYFNYKIESQKILEVIVDKL